MAIENGSTYDSRKISLQAITAELASLLEQLPEYTITYMLLGEGGAGQAHLTNKKGNIVGNSAILHGPIILTTTIKKAEVDMVRAYLKEQAFKPTTSPESQLPAPQSLVASHT